MERGAPKTARQPVDAGGRGSEVFGAPAFDDHEQILFGSDHSSGLRTIIAIHRVRAGRALGGLRIRAYSSEHDAVDDVLRLSRGMSYKAALAKLPCGGAKAVLVGAPERVKTPDVLRAMGRLIESLAGRYVTAEDVGTSAEDLALIKEETMWVLGADAHYGPGAPFTALGVLHAMRGAVAYMTGSDSLEGLTVAVQGVGKVGRRVCALLAEHGASLVIADPDQAAVGAVSSATGARIGSVGQLHRASADIFAPCALGGTLSRSTVSELEARMVVGAANNQLESPDVGADLHQRGIVYVPDYVASAGGIIHGVHELLSYDRSAVERKCAEIFETTMTVLEEAKRADIPPSEAADRLAREMLDRPVSDF